jgi:DNA-binding NtrC family response regulator
VTSRPAPTVWIVDDDLGFVWWLGEIFAEAGCRTLPALSAEDAISLMKKLKAGMDVVVVNPELPGIRGMLQTLSRGNPHLRVVTIGASGELEKKFTVGGRLPRPTAFEPISRPEWLQNVRRLLREIQANTAV